MVIHGTYMFGFSVSKDTGKKKGDGSREDSGTFMSNTNRQNFEKSVLSKVRR
jgi:hypothetical protein